MKLKDSYAEDCGFDKFDWDLFLSKDDHSVEEWRAAEFNAITDATDPVGSSGCFVQRESDGMISDSELSNLTAKFYVNIGYRSIKEAKETYVLIKDRLSKIYPSHKF